MARAGSFPPGVLAVLLCALITMPAHAGLLFTVRTSDDMLRVIDTTTLEVKTVGPLGVSFEFGGLAWDNAGERMYMVTGLADRNLYVIDPNTGGAFVVGNHGVEALFGLAYDPTEGRLFGTRSTLGTGLYRIDPTGLEVTFVGDPEVEIDGLTFDGERKTLVGASAGAGDLYSIDREDAGAELLFDGPFFNNAGITHDLQKDLYWLIDASGDLVTYDPNDGFARTVVLAGLGPHDGIVFLANPPPLVFDPPVRVSDVTDPTAVASIDFTGSRGNDIAVPVREGGVNGAGRLLLLLNDGSGVEYEEVFTNVGSDPSAVTVGDFDGRNGPDAAVTNAGDDTVTILLNDGRGDGTFEADPQVVAVGANPAAVSAGLVDGNDSLDLVVANKLDNTITVLTNDGQGVFAAGAPIAVGLAPAGVGIADLGLGASSSAKAQDLAITNQDDDSVILLTNDGNGGFEEMDEILVGAGPAQIPPEDIDNDKDIDLAIQHDGGLGLGGDRSSGVTLLLNEGDGEFTRIDLVLGVRASSVDVEDLEDDGDMDLLVVSQDSLNRTVSVLRSNLVDTGALTFTEVENLAPDPALELVTTNRMNADGIPDVIVVNLARGDEEGSVEVLLNRSVCNGDFDEDQVVGFADLLLLFEAWGPCEACPEDIDDSGEVDFVDLLLLLANWGPCIEK